MTKKEKTAFFAEFVDILNREIDDPYITDGVNACLEAGNLSAVSDEVASIYGDLASDDNPGKPSSRRLLKLVEKLAGVCKRHLGAKHKKRNIAGQIITAIDDPKCALDMNVWHVCKTTHCLAGWAVHLCGKDGYALERLVGPAWAGAIIFANSHPGKNLPNFYGYEYEARAKLNRLARA